MMDVEMKLYPSRKSLDLKLDIPDQETECPILQEPIQTAVFESFPRPFYKAHPEHKALKLSCSHTFHAMALVYHWSRNRNVLCPICRAGPPGQRLAMNHLPEDWRYSLSSRVRREKRKDKEEAEEENFRLATLISQEAVTRTVVSFVIKIEIQALTADHDLISWSLNTVLTPSQEQFVVFEVPATELRNIPFGEGTTVRLIPFTFSNSLVTMLKPSEWFVVGDGLRSSAAYKVEYAEEGKKFRSIKLMMQEDEFSSLIVDAYFAASVN
jgi:hypothetical protein